MASHRLLGAGALLSLALFGIHTLQARGEDGACVFGDKLDALEEIRNERFMDPTAQIRAELAVRRDVLRTTIACALKEMEDLEAKLSALNIKNDELAQVRNRFLNELTTTRSFYQIQQSKVSGAGIQGSKEIALAIVEWRKGAYAPVANQIVNFMIWHNNQTLIDAADTRISRFTNITHKLTNEKSDEAGALLEAARTHLASAHREHSAVRESFARYLRGGELAPEGTLAHIKQSLQSLSHTYQTFFDLQHFLGS